MESTQPMKTGDESEVDTLDASTKSAPQESMESSVSGSSLPPTTATTLNASTRTWTNAELAELKLKAGLVAGALSEFQGANGLVAATEMEYIMPSGRKATVIKLILVAEDLNMKILRTADGLDFDALPLGSEGKNE